MSYSRWSHSDWYAFRDCSSGKTKDAQVLALRLHDPSYLFNITYGVLIQNKDDLSGFIIENYTGVSEKNIKKGVAIIEEFMSDMDEEFVHEKV